MLFSELLLILTFKFAYDKPISKINKFLIFFYLDSLCLEIKVCFTFQPIYG